MSAWCPSTSGCPMSPAVGDVEKHKPHPHPCFNHLQLWVPHVSCSWRRGKAQTSPPPLLQSPPTLGAPCLLLLETWESTNLPPPLLQSPPTLGAPCLPVLE